MVIHVTISLVRVIASLFCYIWAGVLCIRGIESSIVSTPESSTPFTAAVLAQLKAELGSSDYSMRSLAAAMEKPYGTIRLYLIGERDMPLWVLGRILEVLKVDPEKFMQRAKDRLAEDQ